MSRLFWVRHGPTHAKTMVGWSDLPADLSDTDRLARLSDHLPADAPVISSDLLRAVQTADAIAGTRPRLAPDPDLREIHFGEWEMQSFTKIRNQALLQAFWENPGDVRPPGGESWHDVVARVDRGVGRLLQTHPEQDLIVVAHMGAILTQLQKAQGGTIYETFAQRIENLSVTELHLQGDSWQAQAINHCP